MLDFLSELQTEYEQIARHQIGGLKPGYAAGELVAACRKIVADVKRLRRNIEKLLNEHLYPMLDNIESISDQDEEDLYATVQKISAYETRLDPGLALKIYQSLLERARGKKDGGKTIKYLYWCGITLFYIVKREQRGRPLVYFEEGASFAGKYDEFDDAETRRYIHRCLGNYNMVLYYTDNPQKGIQSEEWIFSFWNRIIFSGKDLDFPWLNYFLTCLTHKRAFMLQNARNEPDLEPKESFLKILDTSMTINKLYHKNPELFHVHGGTRNDLILWEAQFLSGLISFDQFLENSSKKKAEVAADDYSANAVYIKVQFNSYLVFYASKMQKLKHRKDEIVSSLLKETVDYFSSIPMTVNPSVISEQLQMFIHSFNDSFEITEHLNFILKMTTFRHIPTHAHSIMVGRIAAFLTKTLIEKNPACFIGCMDIDKAGEAVSRAETLCEFAAMSGLCHDIGKIIYIGNPFMNTRDITDDEYDILRHHPTEGRLMLMLNDTPAYNGYKDVVAGHHKYYNNSGGYPEDFDIGKSKYRVMIDIISVADSIDAATDNIGKVYGGGKSLETVCFEIKMLAGTRYSPVVAALLEDETVLTELTRILEEERPEAYYEAYSYEWRESN